MPPENRSPGTGEAVRGAKLDSLQRSKHISPSDKKQLAVRANAAHDRAREATRNAIANAIDAGQALIEAKGAVGHGGWMAWLSENIAFSDRTARLYMQMAEKATALPESEMATVANLTLREAAKAISGTNTLSVMGSSATPEWYTPQHVTDHVVAALGEVDLDPSWHPDSPVKAQTTYTAEHDGLAQIWRGRVFLNPPYGRTIDSWIEKLVQEHAAGNVTEAVALVPARVDTEWFRRLDAFPRCFVHGRLTFANADNPAPFPSAIVYLGANVDRFYEAFAPLGSVFVRLDQDAGA